MEQSGSAYFHMDGVFLSKEGFSAKFACFHHYLILASSTADTIILYCNKLLAGLTPLKSQKIFPYCGEIFFMNDDYTMCPSQPIMPHISSCDLSSA